MGHTLWRGMGLGDGKDVALSREVRLFWMMRGRLREVRLGMWDADWFFWVTIAEDDVIPVGDMVSPEVGLSHLFWSGGHRRPPPQWFPQFCCSGLFVCDQVGDLVARLVSSVCSFDVPGSAHAVILLVHDMSGSLYSFGYALHRVASPLLIVLLMMLMVTWSRLSVSLCVQPVAWTMFVVLLVIHSMPWATLTVLLVLNTVTGTILVVLLVVNMVVWSIFGVFLVVDAVIWPMLTMLLVVKRVPGPAA